MRIALKNGDSKELFHSYGNAGRTKIFNELATKEISTISIQMNLLGISGIRIKDTDGNTIFEDNCEERNSWRGNWYNIDLVAGEYLAGFYGKIHWSGIIMEIGAITVHNHSLLEI